jgi:hypothetical protein
MALVKPFPVNQISSQVQDLEETITLLREEIEDVRAERDVWRNLVEAFLRIRERAARRSAG